MGNKKKIVRIFLLIVSLILVIVGGYLGYKKIYLPSQTEYTAEIYSENGVYLEDITFKKGSYLQVLNNEGKIENEIDLTKDVDKIELENAEDTDNLMFSSWEITEEVQENDRFYQPTILYYQAQPIYQEQKDHILTFTVDEKATLLSDNEKEVRYIRKAYAGKDNIMDYLPEIQIDKNFNGDWVNKLSNDIITKDTEVTSDLSIEFTTYQDKNNNNIDDFTEEFTITFVNDLNQEIEDKIVKWEETLGLPVITDDNYVFYDWYIDDEFEIKFTENTKVTDNLTLHAKIKKINEVINESVNTPIYREEIAIKIGEHLNKQNKSIDENYNAEIIKIEEETKALKEYNKENNIVEENLDKVIELHNLNHNKLYLINFIDPTGNYLFSFVAPYGQTLKIFTESGELFEEYGIRNSATIILNEQDLLNSSDELDMYHTEYREINERVFIKLQPIGN